MSDGLKWRRICSLCGFVCFFYFFPNLLLSFNHRQLFWRSSSFDSSYPADLYRPAYINVLCLSVVFLPWDLTLSEADVCYFLLNINVKVHLNLPLLTCWPASCLPSLLLCLHLTFFFAIIYFFSCFKSDTNLHAFFFAPAFHCSMTLGMESGKISDDQISASTSFYDSRWLPRQARLNNNDNAWTPSEDSNKEYIQVRLYLRYLQEAHVRPFRH